MQNVFRAIYEELQMLKSDMERARGLKEQLAELNSKITVTYGVNAGGGGGGIPSSGLERLIIKRSNLLAEIKAISDKVRAYNEAIARALTPLEREIVMEIIDGQKLSHYARRKGIYISTVYKIKDKAIAKIAEYIGAVSGDSDT